MKFKYLGKVPLCNNRPDRGIYINGFCLPLCARCTGILAGSIAGTILVKALRKNTKPSDTLLGAAMILPTAVDGIAEYAFGKESYNKRRLITGLIAGFGCAVTETSLIRKRKG